MQGISEEARARWLTRAVALAFVGSILTSWNLWVSSRLYPLTPIAPIFTPFPSPFDLIALGTLIALLLAALSERPAPYLYGVVFLSLILVAQDQSRLYPSVFEYVLLLTILVAHIWSKADKGRDFAALNICRMMVAATYFWSGLQKFNAVFVKDVFPWLIEPITRFFPSVLIPPFESLGIVAPFLEVGIGIGLLVKRSRPVALWGALLMHAFLFFLIGPLRDNWNNAAWVWNIATAFFVFTLFFGEGARTARTIILGNKSFLGIIALILFGILPALNFVNRWDSALSFNVYSGNATTGVAYIPRPLALTLPEEVRRHLRPRSGAGSILNIDEWSRGEFNASTYPETRIFKNVFKTLCARIGNDPSASLTIQTKSGWFVSPTIRQYGCSEV